MAQQTPHHLLMATHADRTYLLTTHAFMIYWPYLARDMCPVLLCARAACWQMALRKRSD
jgi:hypothetical protein